MPKRESWLKLINHDVPGSIVPMPRPLAATMGYTATESGPGLWIVASAVHREPAAPAMGIGIQAGKRTRSKFFRSSGVAAYVVVLWTALHWSGLRSALKATQRVFEEIQTAGSQRERLSDMLTRKELYELLDYDGYDARDRSYFG